jgi:hypothetical protein
MPKNFNVLEDYSYVLCNDCAHICATTCFSNVHLQWPVGAGTFDSCSSRKFL